MRRRRLTWHGVDPTSAPSIWAFFARPPSTARLRHPTDIVIVVAGLLALSVIGLLHAVDVDAFADAFSIGRAFPRNARGKWRLTFRAVDEGGVLAHGAVTLKIPGPKQEWSQG